MKRIVTLFILLALTTVAAQAQKAVLQGTLKGMPQPSSRLELALVSGGQMIQLDTATLDNNGAFRFDIDVNKPTLYVLRTIDIPSPTLTHIMVMPKEKISVDMELHQQWNIVELTQVKGSENVALYQSFNAILVKAAKQLYAMEKEYMNPSTTDARKHELENMAGQVQASQANEIIKLLRNNPDKLMSAFLVTFFDQNADEFISLYEDVANALKPKYGDNQFVQYIDNKVQKYLGPGRMAPDIVMKDPEGKILKLSDLKGKVVLLDFWASWCRPCRMENPNVVRLYQQYHDKGFEVFSVSLDRKREDWLRGIEQDGLVWPNHVSDLNGWTSSGGATYGVTSIPSTFLIDRDGRIIARNLRGNDLANKLKELLD